MDKAWWTAMLSAAVALMSAALALWGQVRTTRLKDQLDRLRQDEQRRQDRLQTAARYHEPLARAAYDLQSRLFNLLRRDLLGLHYRGGDARSRDYVVDNTVFLIAQYFAWTEIARREVRFIDLGHDDATRALARLQDRLYGLFQTDAGEPLLRLFAGEQRALGERMLVDGAKGADCIGYAAFLDRLRAGADPLVQALRDDLHTLAQRPGPLPERLRLLQHALIDLLDFLDPRCLRFPSERRSRA